MRFQTKTYVLFKVKWRFVIFFEFYEWNVLNKKINSSSFEYWILNIAFFHPKIQTKIILNMNFWFVLESKWLKCINHLFIYFNRIGKQSMNPKAFFNSTFSEPICGGRQYILFIAKIFQINSFMHVARQRSMLTICVNPCTMPIKKQSL